MIFCLSQILIPVLALGLLGLIAAVMLCVVVKKFSVKDDERVTQIESLLPGANCGACGMLGCHDFALECVKRGGPVDIVCPGAGDKNMASIAAIFGVSAQAAQRNVAVVHCSGSCVKREQLSIYNGPRSCKIESRVGGGSLSCSYGCLGCGDCVNVCRFNAIKINEATGLPEVDEAICTGCGACVKACPRNVLQLHPFGVKGRRVTVSCSNKQRGAVARKGCSAACIACGKCVRTCPFQAIKIENNLAVIDAAKCRLCRKCVAVCPSGAIVAMNFPVSQNIES